MGKIFEALEKTDQWRNAPAKTNVENSDVYSDTAQELVPLNKAEQDAPNVTSTASEKREAILKDLNTVDVSLAGDKPQFNIKNIDPRLVTLFAPQSYEAEQFRMLRTNVLFPPNGKPARSIMVTSVAPNEGKSFSAVNIAISIAQNIDKHVLLIDCDMRRPSIHTMLGYEKVMGLSDHLNLGIPLPQLLLKGPGERLTILPGGTIPSNPSELLSSNRMAALLREVKARYNDRFIIIDSPPPQLTSETTALSHLVDGVILIFRMNYSNKSAVKEIIEKIGRERFLGVVANFVQKKDISYYGGKLDGKYTNYYSPPKKESQK